MKQKALFRAVGLLAFFSGAALLAHILTDLSLRIGLAVTTGFVFCLFGFVWMRAEGPKRRRLGRFLRVGLVAGVLATVAYDASKYVLSYLDSSSFNPFEAIRLFGILLAGEGAGEPLLYTTGIGFHALNGICFGVAFCFLLGGRGVLAGVAWGLLLELLQIILYPKWLSVKFYQEFAQISGLSHIVYGAVLALACRAGLRGKRASKEEG